MPPITPHDEAIIEVAGGVDTHCDTHTAAVTPSVLEPLAVQHRPYERK